MSILTDAIHKKITWTQAAAEAAQWATGWLSKSPEATAAVGAALSDAKQMLSDAIGMADTALAGHVGEVADATEAALEAALAKATGGISVPFNPLISDGIDKLAAAGAAAAHLWAMQTKAKLATPAT